MTELRQRMMADMKLHGLAPGTQKVYLNAVRRLAGHYRRSPDQLSEQQLRDYFTYYSERLMWNLSQFANAVRRRSGDVEMVPLLLPGVVMAFCKTRRQSGTACIRE